MKKEVFFKVGQTVWFISEDHEVHKGIVTDDDNYDIFNNKYPIICDFGEYSNSISFTDDGRERDGYPIVLFQNEPKTVTTIETTPNVPIPQKMTIEEMYESGPVFKYKAIDENGFVCIYTTRPIVFNDCEWRETNGGSHVVLYKIPRERAKKCWRDSLVELQDFYSPASNNNKK